MGFVFQKSFLYSIIKNLIILSVVIIVFILIIGRMEQLASVAL